MHKINFHLCTRLAWQRTMHKINFNSYAMLRVFRRCIRDVRSSVAQWQSIRLLTEGLLVRVQPGEPFLDTKQVSFFHGDMTLLEKAVLVLREVLVSLDQIVFHLWFDFSHRLVDHAISLEDTVVVITTGIGERHA